MRSERMLMEQLDYNLLFRWFVGLNADDEVWDATTFTKNRDRLLEADVAKEFLLRVVEQARGKGLTNDEHFTVDGTLLEAWASWKSFQPKATKPTPPPADPGNPTVNFHGQKRSNETHESKTDPGSLLARFVEECRNLRVTPHVAQNMGRRGGGAIDARTTRHSRRRELEIFRISSFSSRKMNLGYSWQGPNVSMGLKRTQPGISQIMASSRAAA
jgi:hypothetical protein